MNLPVFPSEVWHLANLGVVSTQEKCLFVFVEAGCCRPIDRGPQWFFASNKVLVIRPSTSAVRTTGVNACTRRHI
ncbi:hypothetical protein IFM89_033296 [Coptis chinensis]|uniref:Uncharacterized protein n=1 Tax=Coptis chinensis TaxID=261450 RepID=A0A835HTL5_9MAGN|nr:hypothetical protein IFM89_033296 [Coptis chinensis]